MSDRQVIPEAAVEAAAIAVYGAECADLWVDEEPKVKASYLEDARLALEAAAPHMLNLAKREAWDANVEIRRLRAKLAVFDVLSPYTVEDQRQHGETW